MYSALDIAKWFLNINRAQMNFEDSEYITNLKLQKLLYYAQGYYLARKKYRIGHYNNNDRVPQQAILFPHENCQILSN